MVPGASKEGGLEACQGHPASGRVPANQCRGVDRHWHGRSGGEELQLGELGPVLRSRAKLSGACLVWRCKCRRRHPRPHNGRYADRVDELALASHDWTRQPGAMSKIGGRIARVGIGEVINVPSTTLETEATLLVAAPRVLRLHAAMSGRGNNVVVADHAWRRQPSRELHGRAVQRRGEEDMRRTTSRRTAPCSRRTLGAALLAAWRATRHAL